MDGKKKLTLSKETLRLLDDDDLAQVAGGDKGGDAGFTGNGPNGCKMLGGTKTLPPGTIVSISCYYTSCASIC